MPWVTSSYEPYGTGPPVKGDPFRRTVPVRVPVGVPPGGTAPGWKEAMKLASVGSRLLTQTAKLLANLKP